MTQLSSTLVERLQDEADLCRNEGAEDIANLLDEAWRAHEKLVDALVEACDVTPGWLPRARALLAKAGSEA